MRGVYHKKSPVKRTKVTKRTKIRTKTDFLMAVALEISLPELVTSIPPPANESFNVKDSVFCLIISVLE
jgi:hypothetical protein